MGRLISVSLEGKTPGVEQLPIFCPTPSHFPVCRTYMELVQTPMYPLALVDRLSLAYNMVIVPWLDLPTRSATALEPAILLDCSSVAQWGPEAFMGY